MLSDTQNMREFGREIEIIDGKELKRKREMTALGIP